MGLFGIFGGKKEAGTRLQDIEQPLIETDTEKIQTEAEKVIEEHRDMLELIAKFEKPLEGSEDDFVFHATTTNKLQDIYNAGGLMGNLNPDLEKMSKISDRFLKYINRDLYEKGFSRLKGVFAFVDKNFHLDRGTSSEQLILKINTSGMDAIVLDMSMITEASNNLSNYFLNKELESPDIPFRTDERRELLSKFKTFIKEYWGKAVYLKEFKKRFKLEDSGTMITYSDGTTTMYEPEVLIKGDVPLKRLQIYSYPESISQLFSKLGVSTVKEALALVQTQEKAEETAKEAQKSKDVADEQEMREMVRVNNRLNELYRDITQLNVQISRAEPEKQAALEKVREAYKQETRELIDFIKTRE